MPNPLYKLLLSFQKVVSAKIGKILSGSARKRRSPLDSLFREKLGSAPKTLQKHSRSAFKKGFPWQKMREKWILIDL
jgi:hypothetical protein